MSKKELLIVLLAWMVLATIFFKWYQSVRAQARKTQSEKITSVLKELEYRKTLVNILATQ